MLGREQTRSKDLLSRAKQKDLSAVIRLTQLFPYENEIQKAADVYVEEHDLEWGIRDIPSAGDLAKQLVDQMIAFEHPLRPRAAAITSHKPGFSLPSR